MATQVRINPDGEVLITFDAGDGVVFDQPLIDDDDDLDVDPLNEDEDDDEDDEPEE